MKPSAIIRLLGLAHDLETTHTSSIEYQSSFYQEVCVGMYFDAQI
jgi:hypothetical protein